MNKAEGILDDESLSALVDGRDELKVGSDLGKQMAAFLFRDGFGPSYPRKRFEIPLNSDSEKKAMDLGKGGK
ncbi:MAG: hypothetical protein PHX45_04100 [Acidobacteriota bacterium]|nr:hypothetical protein [Acidobacteriota bacterium]